MKSRWIFALAAMVLSACTQDMTSDIQPTAGDLIYASIDAVESRAQLNESQKSVWNANDQIVVHSPTMATLWRFTGQNGDRKGSFQRVGTFQFSDFSAYGFKKWYAFYPYDNWGGVGSFSDGSSAIFFNVPAQQSYTEGSYGIHANAMFATSKDGSNYTFKNLMGYIRFGITGIKRVASIELKGANSEIIAGVMYLSPENPFSLYWYSNGTLSDTISIDCPEEGVQLSDKPTYFYFALPAVAFAKGLMVNVHYTDGSIYTKATSKSILVERNTILPFATIAADGESDWQSIEIHHTGSEIVAPIVSGVGSIDWGDGTTSMIDELRKRYYTDGKESHVITIKSMGATDFQLKSCEGVSKIDLSKF